MEKEMPLTPEFQVQILAPLFLAGQQRFLCLQDVESQPCGVGLRKS